MARSKSAKQAPALAIAQAPKRDHDPAALSEEQIAALTRALDPFESGDGAGRWLVSNGVELVADEIELIGYALTNDGACIDKSAVEHTLVSLANRLRVFSQLAKQQAEQMWDLERAMEAAE